MNPLSPPSDALARRQKADELLERFEEAWQTAPLPSLVGFVPAADDPSRLQVLKDLIKIDVDHRWRPSIPVEQRLPVEEYLKRWPDLAQSAKITLELIRAEYGPSAVG